MSAYSVKQIQVYSLLKIFPIVFSIVGAIIGLFTFFLFPTEVAVSLTILQKVMAWVIFLVIYTALMVVGSILVAWIYNFVSDRLGAAVVIDLDTKE
ncbi:MAG: hypothetical protein LBU55_02780 [Elusimicrobiota bacterium]|jgi:hypothetical protein|nr:hypothetical protein [Elusimicrobiota bacterium]